MSSRSITVAWDSPLFSGTDTFIGYKIVGPTGTIYTNQFTHTATFYDLTPETTYTFTAQAWSWNSEGDTAYLEAATEEDSTPIADKRYVVYATGGTLPGSPQLVTFYGQNFFGMSASIGNSPVPILSNDGFTASIHIPSTCSYGDIISFGNQDGSAVVGVFMKIDYSGHHEDTGSFSSWRYEDTSIDGDKPTYAWPIANLTASLVPNTRGYAITGRIGSFGRQYNTASGSRGACYSTITDPSLSYPISVIESACRFGDFCLELWFKPINASSTPHQYPLIFSIGEEASPNSKLSLAWGWDSSSRQMFINNTSGTNNFQSASPSFTYSLGTDNVWVHYALRKRWTNDISFFVNGTKVYSGTLAPPEQLSTNLVMSLLASCNTGLGGYGYSDCMIDDVRLSIVARSDYEIYHSAKNSPGWNSNLVVQIEMP
jgi:hypothetical protein